MSVSIFLYCRYCRTNVMTAGVAAAPAATPTVVISEPSPYLHLPRSPRARRVPAIMPARSNSDIELSEF